MKYQLATLFAFLSLTLFSQDEFIMTIGGDYLWGENRWGANMNINVNVLKSDHKRPLLIGGSMGMTQMIGAPSVSSSTINSFARENMSGTSLSSASIEEESSELGFGGGFNITKYIYTGFDGVPYVGLGLRYYYFPASSQEVKIQSEDNLYYYTDYEMMETTESFWKPGFELHMLFGTSFEAFYGVYPMSGPNYHYIGMSMPLID
jgi:hypothetical protein